MSDTNTITISLMPGHVAYCGPVYQNESNYQLLFSGAALPSTYITVTYATNTKILNGGDS